MSTDGALTLPSPQRVPYYSPAGHGHGTQDMVLLQHTISGKYLVASRMGAKPTFLCQRCTQLNKDSWESCGITTKTGKVFAEPAQGFKVDDCHFYDNQSYKVVGYSATGKGWLSKWDAITRSSKVGLRV
jgi:hypothetical protein